MKSENARNKKVVQLTLVTNNSKKVVTKEQADMVATSSKMAKAWLEDAKKHFMALDNYPKDQKIRNLTPLFKNLEMALMAAYAYSSTGADYENAAAIDSKYKK